MKRITTGRSKGVLVLTGLSQGDADGEVVGSNINCIAMKKLVFAPDEEIFMDAQRIYLPSLAHAWCT